MEVKRKNSTLLLQKEYVEIMGELKNIKITLPTKEPENYDIDTMVSNNDGIVFALDSPLSTCKISPSNAYLNKREILAYDESVEKYNCLQGVSYHTAHSLICLGETDYIPYGLLTFYFYTTSEQVSKQVSFIKYTKNIELESKRDYMKDRIQFLLENVPPNSLLIIDGPLIAGDAYTYMIGALDDFHEKNIIPVFFVKNSSSNMVIDHILFGESQFNSDLHWAYEFLKKGERSSFIKYTDTNNKYNSKVFCYFKAYDKNPQRIEFSSKTYDLFKDEVGEIVALLYYFILAQGEGHPQVRPIVVAEKYAKEFMKISNIDEYFFD